MSRRTRAPQVLARDGGVTYQLLEHVLPVAVLIGLAFLDLILQSRDLAPLLDEFLLVRDLLLEESGDGEGRDGELRGGRHGCLWWCWC